MLCVREGGGHAPPAAGALCRLPCCSAPLCSTIRCGCCLKFTCAAHNPMWVLPVTHLCSIKSLWVLPDTDSVIWLPRMNCTIRKRVPGMLCCPSLPPAALLLLLLPPPPAPLLPALPPLLPAPACPPPPPLLGLLWPPQAAASLLPPPWALLLLSRCAPALGLAEAPPPPSACRGTGGPAGGGVPPCGAAGAPTVLDAAASTARPQPSRLRAARWAGASSTSCHAACCRLCWEIDSSALIRNRASRQGPAPYQPRGGHCVMPQCCGDVAVMVTHGWGVIWALLTVPAQLKHARGQPNPASSPAHPGLSADAADRGVPS